MGTIQRSRIFALTQAGLAFILSLLVSSCSTVGGTFDDNLELRLINAAHNIFSENEEKFLSNPKKYGKRLDDLAIAFDQSMQSGSNKDQRLALYKAAENPNDPDSWKIINENWRNYHFKLNNIKDRGIYKARPSLFTIVNADSEMMLRIAEESRRRFPDRLRMWDLSRTDNFYLAYGTGVPLEEAKALFLEKLIQDMPALALLPEFEIVRVRSTYRNLWPETIDSELGRNTVAAVLKDAAMRNERISVAEFHHSENVANLLGVTIDIPKANIRYISEGVRSEIPLIQDEDYSNFSMTSVTRRSAARSLSTPADAPTVYILPRGVSINETLLESKPVASSFKTGVVEQANPTYIRIAESISRMKSELFDAEQAVTSASHSKEDVMDSADPRLSDGLKALVGLVAISAATSGVKNELRADSLRRKIQTAQNELSSTPRMLSTPKMSSYQFQALDVYVERQERFTFAVYDMFSDTFDIYQVKLGRDETYTVPKGIYDDDAKLSEYKKIDDYIAAIQEPVTIDYDEFLALIDPKSPGHMVSRVPRLELKDLIISNPDREILK